MITCYFGVPGAGKNTFLASIAIKEIIKQKLHLKNAYEHIYTDFYVFGAEKFKYEYIKKYKMYNSLILIEEMGLNADNRKFANFTDAERDFFTLHRHLGCDLFYATQDYSKVDPKIRGLTQDLWFLTKSVVPFFKHFTGAKRIYRTIAINENYGELILGYRFCNLIESLFVSNYKFCFRPFYYKFFDSFDEGALADRPVLESEPWAREEAADRKEPNPLNGIAQGWKNICTTLKAKATQMFLGVWGKNKQETNQTVLNKLNKMESESQDRYK